MLFGSDWRFPLANHSCFTSFVPILESAKKKNGKKRMAIRGMKEFLPKKRWVSKPPLGRKNRFIIEALDPFCLKASIQNPCDGSDPNHPNDFFYGINQQESSQTTLGNFELKNLWSGRSLEVNSVTLW